MHPNTVSKYEIQILHIKNEWNLPSLSIWLYFSSIILSFGQCDEAHNWFNLQLGIHLPLSPGQVDSSSPARCCAQNTSFTNPSGRAFSIFFSRLNRTSLSGSTKYEKSCYKNFIWEPLCNLLFYNWW